MNKKIAAIGTLASIGFCVVLGFIETSIDPTTYSNLLSVGGLGMISFGIWASVLLLKD